MPTIHNIEFTISISNGGNAAFGESVSEVLEEIRSIVIKALDNMEGAHGASSCYFTKPLRDSNGKKVGKLSADIEFEPEDDDEEVEGEEEYE